MSRIRELEHIILHLLEFVEWQGSRGLIDGACDPSIDVARAEKLGLSYSKSEDFYEAV